MNHRLYRSGNFDYAGRLYEDVIIVSMVMIFIFVTLTILRHNTRNRGVGLRIFIASIFTWGPTVATISLVAPERYRVVLAPLSSFGHCFLYACLFAVSYHDDKTPSQTASKYCRGPHGQSFDHPERSNETADPNDLRGTSWGEAGGKNWRDSHHGPVVGGL